MANPTNSNPMQRSINRWGPVADQAAQKYGVPPDLFRAVITQESRWSPRAVSSKGAVGLGQLMPNVAKALNVDPRDPSANLDGAAKMLSNMLNQFGGREDLALAAYNAGPQAVHQHGGVPPFPETQQYVQRVQALRGAFQGNQNAQQGQPSGNPPQWRPMSAADFDPPRGGQQPAGGQGAPPQPWHPMTPADFNPGGGDQGAPDTGALVKSTRANVSGLKPPLLQALAGAHADLLKQGINIAPIITSGLRSRDEQAALYANRSNNPRPVAAPGKSPHEVGKAVDIDLSQLPPAQAQAALGTLQNYGLGRPVKNDPVHFQLVGPQSGKAAAAPPPWRPMTAADFNPPQIGQGGNAAAGTPAWHPMTPADFNPPTAGGKQ